MSALETYRACSPYFRLASKRWRAGETLKRVYEAFPYRWAMAFSADPSLFPALIAAIRANASSRLIPPSWAFPERPARINQAWIEQNADADDPRHLARFEARQFRVEMRQHQRIQKNAPGRPCVHEPRYDPRNACIACANCGLVLKDHQPATSADADKRARILAQFDETALQIAKEILAHASA